MPTCLTLSRLLVVAAVIVFTATNASASSVALGSDYLQTQDGTFFNFGPGIGNVNFLGLPNTGQCCVDTIAQRQADATINGGPVPLQIVDLSLESTQPVNIGGSFFDVFVWLDPTNLAQDVGQIAIAGNSNGGTFTCSFNVFFEADFLPVAQGQKFSVFSQLMFSQQGAAWTSTPPSGTFLVIGPYGSQSANLHSGMPQGVVDFFPVGIFTLAVQGGGGQHVVSVAPTPEPASMLLFGSAAAIGVLAKLRLRRAAGK